MSRSSILQSMSVSMVAAVVGVIFGSHSVLAQPVKITSSKQPTTTSSTVAKDLELPFVGLTKESPGFEIVSEFKNGVAISGQGDYGVSGESKGAHGVGVYGVATGAQGVGVHGEATATPSV